ncbi:MAG: hypothetical protein DRP42_01540, partial [Tenericutes bacterium]
MSLTAQQILEEILEWSFSFFQSYDHVVEKDIKSGLRETPLVSCQYWVKGLPGVCQYWTEGDPGQCGYSPPKGDGNPSGFNGGKCDFLGRRPTCDKYVVSTTTTQNEDESVTVTPNEDLEQYQCVAPNPFISGLYTTHTSTEEKDDGKGNMVTVSGTPVLVAISKAKIQGYCEGNCDTYGRGTGCGGDPDKNPIVCRYYRPWQMGFGVASPHELVRTDKGMITQEALDAAYAKINDDLELRLPFSFKMFNMRSRFQKCIHWDNDYGSNFYLAANDRIKLDEGVHCVNTDPAATPYHTVPTDPEETEVISWLLRDVWSKGNTSICNGAKPECPCYTGKWEYCNDGKMSNGLRITANQIMELRFWTADWSSQDEYDHFFLQKPNLDDTPSSSIYTFDTITASTNDETPPVMTGWKIDMCQPAPINMREFDPDVYLANSEPITFSQYGVKEGTSAPKKQQIYFPTLVRDLDTETDHVKPFSIIYPYFAKEPFEQEVCSPRGAPICIKGTYDPEVNNISVIGHTVRNKKIYVVNSFYEDITSFISQVEALVAVP